MTTEIRVPQMGESVTEGVIAQWLKRKGETVAVDEPVVEIETDKITVEVPAPAAGVLVELLATEGDTVGVGDVIGKIDESATASAGAASPAPAPAASAPAPAAPAPAPAAPAPAPVAAPVAETASGTLILRISTLSQTSGIACLINSW